MTLLLTACTTDWMVLAQNSEIYFPGKTSTNTNSVHNVVADLNRNNVLSFLGQPLQVDLPQQTNPFQIGQPSIIDNARPLHSVPQPSNPERQGFVSVNRNSQQSTHSPNIIRADPNRQNSVPVTNRPLQSGIFLTNSPTNNQAPQFSTAPNTFGRQPSNSGSSVQQVHNTPTGRPSQTAFQYPASDESGDPYVAFATKLFTVRTFCNANAKSSCSAHPSRKSLPRVHFAELAHRHSELGAQPDSDASCIGAFRDWRQRPHQGRPECHRAKPPESHNSLDFVPKIYQLATNGHRVCISSVRQQRRAA